MNVLGKSFSRLLLLALLPFLIGCSEQTAGPEARPTTTTPYLVVLGTAQDGGAPQTGSHDDPRWADPSERRLATSLGLVDPSSGQRWMFEATPDFRQQWYELDRLAGIRTSRVPDGIFLTHAHIGHYTGLMFLGHESLGAQGVTVYSLPRMAEFLTLNGPWSQLVRYGNIALSVLETESGVELNEHLSVLTFEVPHRQEFSEVAGFVVEGPNRRVGFIPDIDSWEDWDSTGVGLESFLASVDIALLDATFFANGEIPGRDMSGFPHPFITHTMSRLKSAPDSTRAKVMFIHMNHTNPALDNDSDAFREVVNAGFQIAYKGQIIEL